jgi:hypothetical protein
MADDEADEWRFSIDEVGPDEEDRDEREAGWGQDTDATRDGDEDSDAWRVTVGEDNDGPTVAVGGHERAGEDDGNVAGTLAPGSPVEPGTPAPENVAFATAGAVLTAVVLAGIVVPLDPTTVGTITGVIVLGAAALYALFRRF